jgi:hypothetical protein
MKNFLYHLTSIIARDLLICPEFVIDNRHLSFQHPPVLQLMQLVVKSFSIHQLNMVAGFDDSTPVQYDDSVGITDG